MSMEGRGDVRYVQWGLGMSLPEAIVGADLGGSSKYLLKLLCDYV